MFKKMMLLAAAVAALTAFAPGVANAENKNWTHLGAGLPATKTIVTHGTVGFSSGAGGVHCPTTSTVHLEPGSTGTVTAFSAGTGQTPECKYSGGLAALCSEVTAHESTKLPWTVHATKFGPGSYGIVVTNLEVHVKGKGAFCPNVTVTGNAWLTGNPHEGTILHVESNNTVANGTLHSPTTGGHVNGTGTIEITPAGTYTITT